MSASRIASASAVPARTLAELRATLRALSPRREEGVASVGVAAVDELLGGGIPKGRLTELSGRRSSGRTALSLAAIAAAIRRDESTALVDVGAGLDVRRAEATGVVLERLLWLRAGDAKKGVQAAELVLGAGGFGLVVLDLGEGRPRLPDNSWLRLARAAEKSGAALLVVSRELALPTSTKMQGTTTSSWHTSPPQERGAAGVSGSVAAMNLEMTRALSPCFLPEARAVLSLPTELVLQRSRRGGEGRSVRVELRLR